MDFYLATPQGDVHLFSTEDGRVVDSTLLDREVEATVLDAPHE